MTGSKENTVIKFTYVEYKSGGSIQEILASAATLADGGEYTKGFIDNGCERVEWAYE